MKELRIIALFVFLGITNVLSARSLPAYIAQDTIISEGFFTIDRNVSVAKNATLYIKKGVQVALNKGASFLVYGGLVIEGSNDEPVKLFSKDYDNLGVGIKILDKSESQVVLKNVVFDNLTIPLNISGLWQRSSVEVEGCVFRNITTGEPGVIIDNAFPSLDKEIPFSFSKNKFIDNYSNISLGFFESNNVSMKFNNNVITRNFVFGYNDNASLVTSAPLAIKVSDENMRYPVELKENSIFNNYVVGSSEMYVKLTELNLGFKGDAPAVNVTGNYFGGDNTSEEIKATILAENTAIALDTLMDNPGESTPVHIIGLEYHDRNVYNERNEYVPWLTHNFVDSFSVVMSKPIKDAELEEALYSEVWNVLVTSDLSDGDSMNKLKFANNKQVLNAFCPWSSVDEDEKNVPRYYHLKITTENDRLEELYIGRIYLDIYLFENTKKFTFEYKTYSMQEYSSFFSVGGEKVEATKEAPYHIELTRLQKKIEVASAVNFYVLGDEIKAFKKKWKKTPNYSSKDYKALKEKLEHRMYY